MRMMLQQVFLTVSDKADDYELETNFMAWARDNFTLQDHELLAPPEIRSRSVIRGGSGNVGHRAARGRAGGIRLCPQSWGRFSQLPPTARELVELRYQRELKPGAIADLKNWTPNSVYVALSRARALLRDCLESKLTPNEPNAMRP